MDTFRQKEKTKRGINHAFNKLCDEKLFEKLADIFGRQYFLLLFPMLKYCILIGCSLPPKSDIMQDDVNCPISLS